MDTGTILGICWVGGIIFLAYCWDRHINRLRAKKKERIRKAKEDKEKLNDSL